MSNDFFKHGNKVYSENLNDGILLGNAFDWTVTVSLPTDTGSVFPNSSTVGKAKVCDVSITPNSNLSIGSTISNSSGSSQVYRLTVYPNFNRYGGFKSISLTADTGVTFYIANKGGNSPIVNNLDYSDLGSVPELKVLKEYDIVLTIPNGKSVTGLSFVLQSSSADVSGSIAQSNVTGLSSALEGKVNVSDVKNNLTSTDTDKPLSAYMGKILQDSKSSNNHNHDNRYYTETEIGTWTSVEVTGAASYATLEVNEALRLALFKYYRQNYNFTNTNDVTLHENAIPSDYRPPITIVGACFNPNVGLTVSEYGVISAVSIQAGAKTINATAMWHY